MPASYLRGSWIDLILLSTAFPKVFHVLYHFKANLPVLIIYNMFGMSDSHSACHG
jgi:hypothetical protein